MKVAAVVVAPVLMIAAMISTIAMAFAGDTAGVNCANYPIDMVAVLATIRDVESSDKYEADAEGSTASGAYQFIDATWDNYDGYARAVDAPPDIQDAKAAEHATTILATVKNDLALISVVWYLGHVPVDNEWDTIPGTANTLTPREYQTRWLDTYAAIVTSDDDADPTEPGVCPAGQLIPIGGEWSLPGEPGQLTLDALRRPHHDYPAWDWGHASDTPIYNMRGGTVTSIHNDRRNWFQARCSDGSGCNACGIGLSLIDDDGHRWTYCHANNLTDIVTPGAYITAGTQLMWLGNTGRSTGPHLHLSITTNDGQQRCPQPLLEALYTLEQGLDPLSLPTTGCTT